MIAIIDYKAGNIGSVKNALDRLDVEYCVTADSTIIKSADGVIFPGQGRAGQAMKELISSGLDKIIPELKQPFLGICLGMQLLADFSEENSTQCLSIIPSKCRKFPNNLKTPQLGWNKVDFMQNSYLTKNIPNGEYFYFLNSYYFDAAAKYVIGETSYGFNFASIVQKDNFCAVQFHPEKSSKQGNQLLKNFCEASKCL